MNYDEVRTLCRGHQNVLHEVKITPDARPGSAIMGWCDKCGGNMRQTVMEFKVHEGDADFKDPERVAEK